MPDKLTTIGKLDDSDDGLGDDDPDGDHEDDDNGDDASGGQVVVVREAETSLILVGDRLPCLKVKTYPTGFRREHSTVLVFLLLLLLLQTFRCGSTTTPRRGS